MALFVYLVAPVSDEAAVRHLKELGPSAIDTELRGLAPDMGGDVSVMQSFLRMISSMLKLKQDFDLAQAYLALFLKVCVGGDGVFSFYFFKATTLWIKEHAGHLLSIFFLPNHV